MKSVLLISDVSRTKYLVRNAMGAVKNAALIGVARSFLNAEEKAAALEPDIILVEQQSPQMDGVALAASFEAEGLCSDVIILHEDEEPEKNMYSNNVRGFLRYSEIDKDHLETLFYPQHKTEKNTFSKMLRNGYNIPFYRFSLFIVSWPDSVSEQRYLQGFHRLTDIFSDTEHYINTDEEFTVAVFIDAQKDAEREKVISILTQFLEEEHIHGFFFPKLTSNNPIEDLVEAYSFREDVSLFFDEGEYLTVIDQIRFPLHTGENSLKETISRMELAMTEADLQEANQLCIRVFDDMVRKSLSMEMYRLAVDRFNKNIARENSAITELQLSTRYAVSETENQALNFIKKAMKSAGIDYSSRVYDAVNYMRKNYGAKISLQDIAEYAYTNSSYLSQLFHRETGSTLTNYLKDIRMKRACGYLKQKMSVKETAVICGFDDVKYFTRLFRQTMMITPSEYRKQEEEKEVKLPV